MPHVMRPEGSEPFRLTLNTDGERHPMENALAIATLACGIVAFVTAFIPSAHVIAAWTGAVGFAGGLYAQMVSATTPERTLIIMGIVASFVGLIMGIANGGFLP